jgi:hypothetical protein
MGIETSLSAHLWSRLRGEKAAPPPGWAPDRFTRLDRLSPNQGLMLRAVWALDFGHLTPLLEELMEQVETDFMRDEALSTIYAPFHTLAVAAGVEAARRQPHGADPSLGYATEAWLAVYRTLLEAHDSGGLRGEHGRTWRIVAPGSRSAPWAEQRDAEHALLTRGEQPPKKMHTGKHFYHRGVMALWRVGVREVPAAPIGEVRLREPIVRLQLAGGGYASYFPQLSCWSHPVPAVCVAAGHATYTALTGYPRRVPITTREDGGRLVSAGMWRHAPRAPDQRFSEELRLPRPVVGRERIGAGRSWQARGSGG